MKVNSIQKGQTMLKPQTFKGLWGRPQQNNPWEKKDYVELISLYHPFADETEDEIKKAIEEKSKNLKQGNLDTSHHILKEGCSLAFTKKEYLSVLYGDYRPFLKKYKYVLGITSYACEEIRKGNYLNYLWRLFK